MAICNSIMKHIKQNKPITSTVQLVSNQTCRLSNPTPNKTKFPPLFFFTHLIPPIFSSFVLRFLGFQASQNHLPTGEKKINNQHLFHPFILKFHLKMIFQLHHGLTQFSRRDCTKHPRSGGSTREENKKPRVH